MSAENINEEGLESLDLHNFRKNQQCRGRTNSYR